MAPRVTASWTATLDRTDRGIRPTLANAVTVLQHDPAWGPEIFWFDTFLDRVRVVYGTTREWRDEDDTRLTVYLQEHHHMNTMSEVHVASAVRYVARQRARHCVRDWLHALIWDGVPRLETAFDDYWGVDRRDMHPIDYVRAVSRNFFIGMIARVEQPGCKLDTMPVFEGPQGTLKSSALEALGGPWFAVAHETMGTKDFLVALRGKWLVEISELQSLGRAEVTQVKNTMSTRIDTYRPPYGRAAIDFARQCVFAGTTNADTWTTDTTGGRRFWPVHCGEIRLDLLAAARDQLFAEAFAAYQSGATWWEVPDVTLEVQRSRLVTDALTERLAPHLIGRDEITIGQLCDALKLPTDRIDKLLQSRMADCLRALGWVNKVVWRNNKAQRRWVAPNMTLHEDSDVM